MKEPISLAYRRYALGLLLAVNLLNYIDRQVLFAVFPLIKADLSITDTELGLLGSAFMVSYMVIAPVFGWLGDRWNRVKLASTGVVIWSFATILAGFAPGYRTLLAARATVGVGEASFGTVSPGLIADFFEKEKRGSVLSWFYVAIPVGSALGYLLGGVLGQRFGWHSAFLMVGLPGLLIAVPLWFLRTPQRSIAENEPAVGEGGSGYLQLFYNRSFVTNTLAMAAMTFAIGGLAQWIPTFLFRTHSLNVEKANLMFGAVTVVAGILGTLVGGVLGDRWQKKSSKGYLLVSGWGFFIGAPFAAWAIMAGDVPSCMAAIFMAEFFLFLNTGPLNTVIINVTNPGMRAMAFAVNIFFIHALGDAVSPSILGWFSDQWGLRNALLSTPLVMALAGVFCFVCGRFVAHDMAQAEP
ncbi:spinster family MFS transporter [Geomonas azotofigens]|uniref:spinster family MFS transporter n=1 Tax=Geomonas azotofigens TaxID=2843196 RepID=UPI001C1211B1|nr:MFS transporter [Geomonas azotofigens]MBU5613795.1 MFS transporter [Geomonas azotofigens]